MINYGGFGDYLPFQNFGGFGGVYDIGNNQSIVQSIDGIGTKTMLALQYKSNERSFLEFIKKNNIKYIIALEKLDLSSCLNLKNVGDINLSQTRRNFFVEKKTSKSYIFEVDNKC